MLTDLGMRPEPEPVGLLFRLQHQMSRSGGPLNPNDTAAVLRALRFIVSHKENPKVRFNFLVAG